MTHHSFGQFLKWLFIALVVVALGIAVWVFNVVKVSGAQALPAEIHHFQTGEKP